MFIYIIIFFVFVVFSAVEVITKEKKIGYFLFIFSSLLLFTLSFIRWETGTDWDNYFIYFEDIFNRSYESDGYESGYRLLNYLVRIFTDNYTVFLMVSAAILFFFQSKAISQLSLYPMLSITFLFAIQFGNIFFVRQWIAVAILFYSIIYIKNNKFIPFLLCVIIASTIHRTSIIFILAWWLYRMKISFKTMSIALLLSVLFSYILENVLNSLIGNFGGIIFQEKLTKYLNESYNSELKEEMNFTLILIKGMANKFFLLFLSMYMFNKFPYNKTFIGIINLYWFGCFVYFIALPISIVIVRFSYAFDIMQIILVSYMIAYFRHWKNRIIIFFAFIMFIGLRFIQLLNNPYIDEFVPFKTIAIF